MKIEKQIAAKKLRTEGKSIKDISRLLSVSKSSVSLWVRNINLSEEQKEKLLSKSKFTDNFSCKKKEDALNLRKEYQNEGRIIAQEKDLLHCMGCMLFWAEGTKSKNDITFTNSDVNMMKLFIRFLKEKLLISNDQISLSINCFLKQEEDIDLVHEFWVNQLNIGGCKINKPTIKIIEGDIENNGICCIRVFSTKLAQQLYGAIQEYANFSNGFCLENKRSRS